jgi:hypothetical protein
LLVSRLVLRSDQLLCALCKLLRVQTTHDHALSSVSTQLQEVLSNLAKRDRELAVTANKVNELQAALAIAQDDTRAAQQQAADQRRVCHSPQLRHVSACGFFCGLSRSISVSVVGCLVTVTFDCKGDGD